LSSGGRYLVTWVETDTNGTGQSKARLLDINGATVVGVIDLPPWLAGDPGANSAAVTYNPNLWSDSRNGPGSVYGQLMDDTAALSGSNFEIDNGGSVEGNNSNPKVAGGSHAYVRIHDASSGVPAGSYTWYYGLMQPGTCTLIGAVGSFSFTVTPF
jgi:hypothetical protein